MKTMACAALAALVLLGGARAHDALLAHGERRAIDEAIAAAAAPGAAVDRLVARDLGLVFHPARAGYWSGSHRYRGTFTCMIPLAGASINMDGAGDGLERMRMAEGAETVCRAARDRLLAAQKIPAGDHPSVLAVQNADYATTIVSFSGGEACRIVNGGMFFLPANGQSMPGFEASMPACKAWVEAHAGQGASHGGMPFFEI